MNRRKRKATSALRPGRPVGSFTQHRRLDRLKRLLEQHPAGLTLEEIAEQLQVTTRSVRRYLKEANKEYELERILDRSRNGLVRWRVLPSELPRKVQLRRTQAYALLAARKVFEPMRGSTLYEEIEMAIQRIQALAQRPGRGPNAGVADARLQERFVYLPVAPKDYAKKTAELDDVFQAVADLRPLSCRYKSASRGVEERIVIHPYALVLYKDAIYCVAYHTGHGEIRTFALDRMRDTETSALERFTLPDDFRVEDYFQGQFGIWRSAEKHKVVVDFDPKVAELVRTRKVHATQKLKELPNKGVRLTMTIGDLREVTSWLLGWGPMAKVIEPAELVERMREELEGALAKYREGEEVTVVRGKRRA